MPQILCSCEHWTHPWFSERTEDEVRRCWIRWKEEGTPEPGCAYPEADAQKKAMIDLAIKNLKSGLEGSDEIKAALRSYQKLGRILDKQTAAQKSRLEERLAQEEREMDTRPQDVVDELELEEKQGFSYSKVTGKLNEAENRASTGGLFNESSIQTRYDRIKKEEVSGEAGQPDRAREDTPSGQASQLPPVVICPELIPELLDIIREEIQPMLSADWRSLTTQEEIPPATPHKKSSKRYKGTRNNLPGCRIDKVLLDLFRREREQKGISARELMQRILWSYFGKPPLSFEISETSEND